MAHWTPLHMAGIAAAVLAMLLPPSPAQGWTGARFAPKVRPTAQRRSSPGLRRSEGAAAYQLGALLKKSLGPGATHGQPSRKVRPHRPLRPNARDTAHMEAFEQLVASVKGYLPFAGHRVIGVQHLLPDTAPLMEAIANSGAGKGNIDWMGKTYSQDHRMIERGRSRGYHLTNAQFESDLDIRFGRVGTSEAAKNNRIPELLRYLDRVVAYDPTTGRQGNPKQRFLVFDDGGELIELIHRHYPQLHDRIVAVEQTRKGIRRVADFKGALRFPVIDVAGSMGKLAFESRLIGRDLANATRSRLARLRAQGIDPGKRLVSIGFGSIGTAAAQALRHQGYTVEVYDKDPKARRRAATRGFVVYDSWAKALRNGNLVLSTTGESPLDQAALALLPDGAILMNGASSATEMLPRIGNIMKLYAGAPDFNYQGYFRGRAFRMGGMRHNFEAPAGQDWVIYRRSGKELLLVNQGHPINFDGRRQGIPPRYIQLTRGLLYLGGVQAVRTTKPGIHKLWLSPQRSFLHAISEQLRRTGESLSRPRF